MGIKFIDGTKTIGGRKVIAIIYNELRENVYSVAPMDVFQSLRRMEISNDFTSINFADHEIYFMSINYVIAADTYSDASLIVNSLIPENEETHEEGVVEQKESEYIDAPMYYGDPIIEFKGSLIETNEAIRAYCSEQYIHKKTQSRVSLPYKIYYHEQIDTLTYITTLVLERFLPL